MKLRYFCPLIVVSAGFGFIAPQASAQGEVPNQAYGSSIPYKAVQAPVRRGKEKTEQVDIKKVPTKSATDTRFQGSLLDIALDPTADIKSHGEKPESNSTKDSKATDAGDKGHNKEQKATSTQPAEKASVSSPEKSPASKPDGTH
jgi:hypothetical protein